MNTAFRKTFLLDLESFRKHILWKYIVLFFINLGVLGWAYNENKNPDSSFYMILIGVLILIGFIFWRNGKRQLDLLTKTVYEFENGILKHYGSTESCQELELKNTESLKYEILLGRKRVLLKTESGTYTYSRIEHIDDFIKNLERYTGKQIQELKRNKWEIGLKFILIYLPSAITFVLAHFPNTLISMNIFFLILNLNTIFFVRNLSEEKLEGGISERISRRIVIILVGFFIYQFYLLFYAT